MKTLVSVYHQIAFIGRHTLHVYTDEYKTIYSFCADSVDWNTRVAVEWKYKKAEFKTLEAATEQFKKDFRKRYC